MADKPIECHVKFIKPKKSGTQLFSRNKEFDYNDASTYAEIKHLDNEELASFNCKIYDYLDDARRERLFFYIEYIKRHFYLDCCIEKTGTIYKMENSNYVHIKLKNDEDCILFIANRFMKNEGQKRAFYIQLSSINRVDFSKYNYDICNFIKTSFNKQLSILKDILSNPLKVYYIYNR